MDTPHIKEKLVSHLTLRLGNSMNIIIIENILEKTLERIEMINEINFNEDVSLLHYIIVI